MLFVTKAGKLILRNGKLLSVESTDTPPCCCCQYPCENDSQCPNVFGDGRNRCKDGCCVSIITCCVGGGLYLYNDPPEEVEGLDVRVICEFVGGTFYPGQSPEELPYGACLPSCCIKIESYDINGEPVYEVDTITDGRTKQEACPACLGPDVDPEPNGDCPDGYEPFSTKCRLKGTPEGCGSWVSQSLSCPVG